MVSDTNHGVAACQHAGMQYRPTADELLECIAELLTDEVLPVVPAAVQHKVRVAANLANMLRAEWCLGAANDVAEVGRLQTLLGHDGPLDGLRDELSERLRSSDDADFDRAAWHVLVATSHDELAIAKPGHDSWEGQ